MFTIAKPIPKEDFLKYYKDSTLAIHLLFSPFGQSSDAIDILGESAAGEDFPVMIQQVEELVAKSVFSIQGYNDDRIVTSMNTYIGKEHPDDEVALLIILK